MYKPLRNGCDGAGTSGAGFWRVSYQNHPRPTTRGGFDFDNHPRPITHETSPIPAPPGAVAGRYPLRPAPLTSLNPTRTEKWVTNIESHFSFFRFFELRIFKIFFFKKFIF